MSETNQNSSTESIVNLRILRLNTDKTRKTFGSDTIYEVYFEMSGTPSLGWRDIFKREWKTANSTQDASIDRGFIIMHCTLQEIATHLPFIKAAVDATNKKYRQYVQEQVIEQEHRDGVWKQERKNVDDVAKLLHFD
jgi:hypothetical protein